MIIVDMRCLSCIDGFVDMQIVQLMAEVVMVDVVEILMR